MAVYQYSREEGKTVDSMTIKSFYGDYKVHFGDRIDYSKVVKDGDIVVVDRKVYDNYRDEFKDILNESNTIIIDATENQKSYEGIIPVINLIIEKGFHKNNTLIAIGGGITQDVVAFISSILFRGVKWELIPTTLLAQCDSCIGSKTSINFGCYKNQVGGFYPPRNVYIAPHFLKTLHERELKSGLGEMLHYYVVGGKEDFEFFADNYKRAMSDDVILQKLIFRSLAIKKGYIEIDEYDRNERQIFNYGHSFGHAIESMTDYAVPHGIAVSYGMDIANNLAVEMGIQTPEVRDRIRKVTEFFWNPDDIPSFDIDNYINLLRRDKKNKGNKLGIIICTDYGNLSKHMIKVDEKFRKILVAYFKNRMSGTDTV